MSVSKTAKSKFYIGGIAASPSPDLTAYEAATWVQLVELLDLGEFGDTAEMIELNTISADRKRYLKGVKDGGTMEIKVARSTDDPGQPLLKAALASDANFMFKVVLADHPTEPTEVYFSGVVGNARTTLGEGSNVVTVTFSIAINTAILEVEAA